MADTSHDAVLAADRAAPLHGSDSLELQQLLAPVVRHYRGLIAVMILAGGLGAGASFLVTPVFSATTTFLPPQQQQSAAASALASLGSLTGLAGVGNVKNPTEQYVSLMQSVTVSDRLIDRFKLMDVYKAHYRRDARNALAGNVKIGIGKKDGIVDVTVEDVDPARAAAIANQYVEELRRMTSVIAVSEAQQRRAFFEKQMQETKTRLIAAQTALQDSGFDAGAMRAEPKAAAEEYARLRAELMAAEVKLQTLRSAMTESAPQVQQQSSTVQALRGKVGALESVDTASAKGPDYVSKYREFKYQETLFDLLAKQYEVARVDESREGALIQVIDPATPAEVKSKPRRSLMTVGAALAGSLLFALAVILRGRFKPATS